MIFVRFARRGLAAWTTLIYVGLTGIGFAVIRSVGWPDALIGIVMMLSLLVAGGFHAYVEHTGRKGEET